METVSQYLNPDVVAKLGSMELRARLVVEGFITGLHRSPFHGFSAEFSEHRQYRPGDELKHIDWKIYGRSDRFYVKQYEDETNLRCMIALDCSASMGYAAPGNLSKFTYGSYLAAALSYLILQQRDAAGLTLYTNTVEQYLPSRSKKSYISELIRALEAATPHNTTGTAAALNSLAERLTRRGLVVLISDLFDEKEEIFKALRHFRHNKNEVLVMHVLDPREVDFDFQSSAVFKDMETGQELPTHPLQLRNSYQKAVQDFCADIKKGCRALNVDYIRITTNKPFDVALREYIVKRAKRI
ncbi:MAG: DUF58 domain-containing protein [Chlorobi bacterium]|nr:MAG: DUF58 domain-containing protein [Bacteroidota bacterium]KXK34465.1 MAG: von Willebrand factor type A [Chlorobi bacterium OLB6]MBE2266563.1 DUF58 domain-containing protein [Flavobacteriales bacterium]MBL1161116.1 DUF58 domain-containing protein [Chlorobiota bacterium]MBW7854519.1 DUF58 domain-containing protein [Candidatus Kapabacteria bacterium]MCC6331629.1 DUF58 domain-containing protein [Ignavibacteria bacterium]